MTISKFEYRITFLYLLIGSIWIIFSDRLLHLIIVDATLLTEIQTYKGWFYVFVTALLFFIFIKKHLNILRYTEKELEKHRNNLEQLVVEKTKDLDIAFEKLSVTNKKMQDKNEIISQQNIELKRAFKDLKDTQAQLFQADKMASLGILTAGVAHEINNPLNYILGGVTGLENYFHEEKNQNKNISLFINSIKSGIDRVSSIVNGLNKLSRNNETYDEECDIHEIIENCLTIINSELKNRIQIIKEFSNNRLIVQGNIGQMHQVFINILVNASQSINNKGSISIMSKAEKEYILIEISDTGCGIEKENISKITDPFFTTKEAGKGTGLGLSITYNIIQMHKGTITFESEQNKGTTVKIILPLKS